MKYKSISKKRKRLLLILFFVMVFRKGINVKTSQVKIREAIAKGETSLGIEFGSTRIKAVLIDNQFETIATGSYEWENRLEDGFWTRSEEHTSELQSRGHLVCRLLLEK